MVSKPEFSAGEMVVYPTHGVGLLEGVEMCNVAGRKIKLYSLLFEKERLRVKLPVARAEEEGLRKISSRRKLGLALESLQRPIRARRQVWNRRAQECEDKIRSGDPMSLAEVLRELHPNQSYSESQLYHSALERLARELAAVEKIAESEASKQISDRLEHRQQQAP